MAMFAERLHPAATATSPSAESLLDRLPPRGASTFQRSSPPPRDSGRLPTASTPGRQSVRVQRDRPRPHHEGARTARRGPQGRSTARPRQRNHLRERPSVAALQGQRPTRTCPKTRYSWMRSRHSSVLAGKSVGPRTRTKCPSAPSPKRSTKSAYPDGMRQPRRDSRSATPSAVAGSMREGLTTKTSSKEDPSMRVILSDTPAPDCVSRSAGQATGRDHLHGDCQDGSVWRHEAPPEEGIHMCW